MESTPPIRRATVAGFLGPALLVVELQGVACANPTAVVGDSLASIVSTACQSLAGVSASGGVRLLAAYAMDRRPCATKTGVAFPEEHGTGAPMRADDVCTVLCVGALRSASTSHWVALDMNRARESTGPRGTRARRGRKWFAIGAAQATLLGCFTRHASINSCGAIDRNMGAADGCETCARTWRDFRLLLSRPRPRQRVNAARVAAVTAASLDARRWFRSEAGLVDVLCAGAVALREVAPRLAPTDPHLVRAERALATLGAQIEAALAVCLWADRFGASAALAIMADADARAATTLPEHPPQLRQPTDVLESVVDVAVAAGLLVARANLAAAGAFVTTTGSDGNDDKNDPATSTTSIVSAELTSSWISSVLSDRGEADMGDWAARATAIFARVRQAAAAHAKRTASATPSPQATTDAQAHLSPIETAPRPRQQQQQQRRQKRQDTPPVPTCAEATSCGRCPTAAVLRCARAGCRAPGRRITSGCVITAHCTCGCRATFHRACWEDAGIVLDASGTACPTPDCWGEIARVTSTRSRATERPPRVLWESPTATSGVHVPTGPIAHDDHRDRSRRRDDDDQGHCAGDRIHCDDRQYDGRENNDLVDHDQRPQDKTSVQESDPSGDRKPPGDGPVFTMPRTGGTPYHKVVTSHEDRTPIRRKRPRNRSGKKQRCRVAKQQHDRLLALAGLGGAPLDPSDAKPAGPPRSDPMDDDSLWPSFFVPDPL
ncbi:hypothetical protein psal_cds_1373 [Pandoravirus salinus]|uniref:Uncharacterized protein n=1 Tax=Pandoravirus salinus TaxID=1349410 RepID=S4VZI0_9VIRU|nr:hypothetical protein psal_cds_1373 [Pandoravirus salinus]AGO85778.1 hypothetical protein psal_cds_1373 [Pandoravirus salinus]